MCDMYVTYYPSQNYCKQHVRISICTHLVASSKNPSCPVFLPINVEYHENWLFVISLSYNITKTGSLQYQEQITASRKLFFLDIKNKLQYHENLFFTISRTIYNQQRCEVGQSEWRSAPRRSGTVLRKITVHIIFAMIVGNINLNLG